MKKIKGWIKSLFSDYVKYDHQYDLEMDSLYDQICNMKQRIAKLEEENTSTTNELYRLENSLDSRIDILTEEIFKRLEKQNEL